MQNQLKNIIDQILNLKQTLRILKLTIQYKNILSIKFKHLIRFLKEGEGKQSPRKVDSNRYKLYR